jgi:hypothetical protein
MTAPDYGRSGAGSLRILSLAMTSAGGREYQIVK